MPRLSDFVTAEDFATAARQVGAEIAAQVAVEIRKIPAGVKVVPSGVPAAPQNIPSGARYVPSAGPAVTTQAIASQASAYQRLAGVIATTGAHLAKIPQLLSSARQGIVALGATIYTVRSLGRAIDSFLVEPLKRLADAFVDNTELSRKFEISMSGLTGLERAREINRALVRQSRNLPISLEDLRESALALRGIPALADRITSGNAEREIERFSSMIQRLGQLDSEGQGVRGALISARNLSQGDTQSLRRRFGLSEDLLASAIGKDVSQLRGRPEEQFKALEAVVNVLVPKDAALRANQLVSTRVQQLRDSVGQALADVGDSGAFDAVVSRLEHMGKDVFSYFDSSAFRSDAQRASNAIDRAVGNVAGGLGRLLRKATGTKGDASSVQGVGAALTDGIERLARLSDNLPDILSAAGVVFGEIADKLGKFVDSVIFLGDVARDPAGFARGAGQRALKPGPLTGQSGSVQGDANQITLGYLRKAGIDVSRVNESIYDPKTTDETLYRELRQDGSGVLSAGVQAMAQTLRDAAGSTSAVHELDFRHLPVEQRLLAERIYAQVRETGAVSNDILEKIGGKSTARPAGFQPDLGPLKNVIRDEWEGGNYAVSLTSLQQKLAPLMEIVTRQSELDKLVQARTAGLDSGIFTKLAKQFQDDMARIDRALQDGAERLAKGGDADVAGQIEQVKKLRTKIQSRYDAVADLAAETFVNGARAYSRGLVEALSDVPLSGDFQRTVAEGTGRFAQDVAKTLEDAGQRVGDISQRLGLASWDIEDAQAFAEKLASRRAEDIDMFGRAGVVRLGMTPDQISQAYSGRPDQYGVARMQLEQLQSESLPMQSRILTRANIALGQNPDDPLAVRDASIAASKLSEMVARLHELELAADPARQAFVQFAGDARQALDSNLGDGIANLILQTGSLGDAFRSLANDVIHAFSRMAANNILNALLGNAGQPTSSGVSPIGGILGSLFPALGGSIPVGANARGGIVSSPMLSLIGERQSEAVIPMPDGRSIPMTVRNGRLYASLPGNRMIETRAYAEGGVINGASSFAPPPQQTYTGSDGGDVYIVNSPAQMWAMGFRPNRDTVINTVAGNIKRGGAVQKSLTRAA